VEVPPSDNSEAARLIDDPRSGAGPRRRLYAALVLLACVAVLALAVWLEPDPHGYGTHRQLGFGKCAMLITSGLPCPTCGMTTAFAYTMRGRVISAFLAQPAGLLLALATVACAAGAGWVVIAGRFPPVPVPVLTPYRLFLGLLVVLIGSWGFKIAIGLLSGALPDRG
jgi:hypothetical protein